jgi:hypothetical protein
MGSFKDKISIAYQRDDSKSYIIIKIKDQEALINYQIEMVTKNKIPGLLQVDMRVKDNNTYFYYNVTSKVPLIQFLKRRKITKNDLTNILMQITETMLAGGNFLLSNKCFVLKEDYIYINPATNEISLLYIPIEIRADKSISLKDFAANFIVYSAFIDGEDMSDNYIQKILSYVKCETFNITNFNKMLSHMYGEKEKNDYQDIHDTEKDAKDVGFKNQRPKNINIQRMVKSKISKLLLAGISQLLIIVVLLLSSNFLKLLGGNIKTTRFAVGLIWAAIDVVIFKNIFTKKQKEVKAEEIIIKNNEKREEEDENYVLEDVQSNDIKDEQLNTELLIDSMLTISERAFLKDIKSGEEKEIIDKNSEFLIGRLESYVDLVVQNNAVGKVHAQITHHDGGYYIEDLNSKNGTIVNGVQISSNSRHEVKDGDKIIFANSVYEFKISN